MREIREYILKGQEVFVGLEDSKKTWKICVRSNKLVVHESSMPAKYEVLRNYFNNKFPECKIHVMYEAGFRGFELNDHLEADGWGCVVTPPHTVTEEKCNRTKNDRIDCRRLAKNLENGDYKACFVPDKELREDRQISRVYGQIQKDIIRVSNRLRKTMEFHGLEYYFPSGRWHRGIYRKVKAQLEGMELSHSLRFSFNVIFNELEYLWEMKKEVLKELMLLAKSNRYNRHVELLKSMPGVGKITSIRLILEWGNVNRFKRKEEFSKFLGLIPRDYSTGEFERQGRITKQGNRYVRSWLVESAWVAIRHDPVLLEKYRNIASRNDSKKKAIVAVARKLAIRMRAVLLTGEPYIVGVVE